jgi:hypothetical protein
MQKRKPSQAQKIDHFDNEHDSREFMAEMMNDFAMHHSEAGNVTAQLASGAMNSAMALSKLIVENRGRNSDRIDDNDIYDIYQKSFNAVMTSVTGFDQDD